MKLDKREDVPSFKVGCAALPSDGASLWNEGIYAVLLESYLAAALTRNLTEETALRILGEELSRQHSADPDHREDAYDRAMERLEQFR